MSLIHQTHTKHTQGNFRVDGWLCCLFVLACCFWLLGTSNAYLNIQTCDEQRRFESNGQQRVSFFWQSGFVSYSNSRANHRTTFPKTLQQRLIVLDHKNVRSTMYQTKGIVEIVSMGIIVNMPASRLCDAASLHYPLPLRIVRPKMYVNCKTTCKSTSHRTKRTKKKRRKIAISFTNNRIEVMREHTYRWRREA